MCVGPEKTGSRPPNKPLSYANVIMEIIIVNDQQ